MAFGFSATNGSNQFLVTDEFTNMHFLGKATQTVGTLANGATEFENGDFESGDLSSETVCTSSSPAAANGSSPPNSGLVGNTPILFNGVIVNGRGDDNTVWFSSQTASYVHEDGWFWFDLGCAQTLESMTLYYTYTQLNRQDIDRVQLFYSDSQPTSSGSFLSNINFDSRHNAGHTNQFGSFTSVFDVTTRLPHRYWGMFFPQANGNNGRVFASEVQWTIKGGEHGGSITQVGELDPRTLHTFSITSTEPPLVFIKPTDLDRWHALIDQSNSGNLWTFQVLVSGDNNISPPELYCFVPPGAIAQSTENFGLLVQDASGNATFDSRIRPLAIVDGGTSIPPTVPCNGGTPTSTTTGLDYTVDADAIGLDFDFTSHNSGTFNSNTLTTSVSRSNLMFAAPSLTQAVYSRLKQAEASETFESTGSVTGTTEFMSTVLWWVLYRNAFRLSSSSTFDSGWNTWLSGINYTESAVTNVWRGSGSTNTSVGEAPYTDQTINLTSNAYLMADASKYE